MLNEEQIARHRMLYCVPVYLQELGYPARHQGTLKELGARAIQTYNNGLKVVEPWAAWRGLAGYLASVEFARHSVQSLPLGEGLTLQHETKACYHIAAVVFFAQALADNLATWLAKNIPLPISGGDCNFLKKPFRKEFTRHLRGPGTDFLDVHDKYLKEVEKYRQIWIHQHAGGGVLLASEDPWLPNSQKMIGVPIDPAFAFDAPRGLERAEKIAAANGGRYLYGAVEFADRITDGAAKLFFSTLQMALDHLAS